MQVRREARMNRTVAAERMIKMIVFEKLKTALRNRALYLRTRDEIASLSPMMAQDVGLAPANAGRIARKAVYGRA